MSQIQCGNCGGYRVILKRIRGSRFRNPQTGEIRPGSSFVLVNQMKAKPLWWQVSIGLPLAVALALSMLLVFPILLYSWDMRARARRSGFTEDTYFNCRCEICNYQWVLWAGDPLPPGVKPSPGLIAQGEARLREEEKRRQDLAAGTEAAQRYFDDPGQ